MSFVGFSPTCVHLYETPWNTSVKCISRKGTCAIHAVTFNQTLSYGTCFTISVCVYYIHLPYRHEPVKCIFRPVFHTYTQRNACAKVTTVYSCVLLVATCHVHHIDIHTHLCNVVVFILEVYAKESRILLHQQIDR